VSKLTKVRRMTYERGVLLVDGHAPECGVQFQEPCDCAQGVVRAIEIAFAADLRRITPAGRAALEAEKTGGEP